VFRVPVVVGALRDELVTRDAPHRVHNTLVDAVGEGVFERVDHVVPEDPAVHTTRSGMRRI
jgi:hypothetical protein